MPAPPRSARLGSPATGLGVRQSLEQKVGLSPADSAFRYQTDKDRRASEPVASRVRDLKNLVSAGPSPSAASPHASPALRMQRRRTNRGRGPATEFVSKCWIGRRGGLEDRLKRRDDRQFGPAAVAHDPSPKGWLLLPDHRGHREGGPRPGESSATSRGGYDAHGRTMMPRLDEDSATGAGRIATRRLDADDRVRVSSVRSILRAPHATG